MPQFKLDFEVYCRECDTGLCNESEVDQTRYNTNRIYVDKCPYCAKTHEDEIRDLQQKIEDLEYELEEQTRQRNCND